MKERYPSALTRITGKNKIIYLFKFSRGNNRTMCEICSKLTIKIPKQQLSSVFIVNFDRISSQVSNVAFEQVNASWGYFY